MPQDSNIPFTAAYINYCLCPQCPVQSSSPCVDSKMSRIKEALKSDRLKSEDIPELYCATGIAACQDINTSQPCICGGCPVFGQYQLASKQPVGYYCRDGSAK